MQIASPSFDTEVEYLKEFLPELQVRGWSLSLQSDSNYQATTSESS